MNKFFDAIKELTATTTKVGMKNVLKENEDTLNFKLALQYLLNDYEVVGLSTKKLQKDIEPNKTEMDLKQLLDYLHENPTGTDDTIAIVKGYVSQFEPQDEQIILDLIAKTLKLGVSAKTVNTVYGEKFVPTFDVQLAFPYEKAIKMYSEKDTFYVTKKLDGHRAITLVEILPEGISISTYTRKGQPYEGLFELHSSIIELIKNNPMVMQSFRDGFMLDGELLLMNQPTLTTNQLYNATTKVLKKQGEKTNLKYHIFDMTSLEDFLYNSASTNDYEYRRTHWLDNMVHTPNIEIVSVLDKTTKDKIMYWSDYATEQGWEGVMLNASKGLYRKTRSQQLLKVKKMHTADLEIVGFNRAIDGKLKDGLKSLIVKLDDENNVDVGSGIPLPLREEIWNNQDAYLGTMVEVQYFEESANQNGGKSLRFPVFKCLRPDKTPEDANIE